tara:strand:- start:721 stop:1269 length:549 start_codon:yes stop_codon:yes gene_type:complete
MINNKQMYLEFLKEEGLTKETLPYNKYTSVIKMHNIEVMRQLIEENKSYNMDFLLGSLMIIEKRRKIRISENGNHYTSINWPESNKKKKELLEQGRLPKEVYKDEHGKITGDNGGENWIIYSTSETIPRFYWSLYKRKKKDNGIDYPLSRIRRYRLQITIKNRRLLLSYNENHNISYTKEAV